ncbi:MAG: hypothetical protein J6P72_09965 [Firmicutes bacterium]|nr:hypothetical protein [Bacillota bacterium]
MAGLLQYKCPCCGGAIEWNSTLQKMKCPYCDTEFDLQTLQSYDQELATDKPDSMEWQQEPGSEWTEDEASGLRVYVCQSCGGEIVGDANTAATSCPYCGNPVMMMGNFAGNLKPDYVIPFKLDKEAAKKALKDHLATKKLLPKVFKDENHIDEIKGIYVPFWVFDADADAKMRYRATRVRTWNDPQWTYTETSFFQVIRGGSLSFDHVPVDGSSKLDDTLMESIEPYDFSQAVPFQTAYLAGYLADKYDVDKDQTIGRANQRIKESTQQAFDQTVTGYVSVQNEYSNIQLNNGVAKYALYPVWLLNTSWEGKQYTFAMNGQSGKFVGDLPMDKKLYWKRWGLIAGITAALVYGASWLFTML